MDLKLLTILYSVCSVHSVTINSVQIRDNLVPVKGSSIQLVCSVTGFSSSTPVQWVITDTQDIPETGSFVYAQCVPQHCFPMITGHTYTADDNHMYVNITKLSQSNDGKWWTCKCGNSKQALKLVIYTVPTSIQYDRVPDGPQDLSVNAVTLECRTNCVHPQPSFTWFYVTANVSQYQYTSPGNTSSNANTSCTSPEKDYKSTLTLPRYTVFADNSDTTIRFRCGITSFPGLLTELYTQVSQNVTFAVYALEARSQVPTTTPTLANKTTSGSLIVLFGDVTRLVCITSATRPAAIVTWKIGETTLQNVSNTFTITPNNLTTITSIVTFTPNKTDNKKTITCMTRISGQTDPPNVKHSLNVWWGPSNATIEPSSPFPWRENQTDKYLLCNASNDDNGNSAPTANWTSQYGTPDTTNRLVFKLLSSFHNKMAATCELSNEYTRLNGVHIKSQIAELDVYFSPKIILKKKIFVSAISDDVRINVPYYSYPPAKSVHFTRQDGEQIQNTTRTTVLYEIPSVMTDGEDVIMNSRIAYLQINDTQETDFTKYTMEVTNSIGNSCTVIKLISQSAPTMPRKFTRTDIGETNVVVSWETGFHGGNNQTFVIQLRKENNRWYNRTYVFGGMKTTGFPMSATLDMLSKRTQYYVRVYSYNAKGTSPFTYILNFTTHSAVTVEEGIIDIGPIIKGGVGLVIVLVVIGVVIFLFKRKIRQHRGKKKVDINIDTRARERLQAQPRIYENIGLHNNNCFKDDDDEDDPENIEQLIVDPVYGNTPLKPISVKQLRSLCRNATNDPSSLYREFKEIPAKFQLDTHEAAKPRNRTKIRYREMYAYDKNRVTLPLQPGNYSSDFINASYIRGYNKDNMYIASQGAMKDTVEDVWRMVWQHRIATIVMLTNCKEDNRVKCIQYWPALGEEKYGNFCIKAVSEDVYSEFTIRTFTCKMSGSGSQIEVTQYHFTAWPDKDVPNTCLSLVQLWKKVKHSKHARVTPWIVHCSAGVGRTGTFIALDYLYDQGMSEGSINVHACVSELRDQRLHMVQTSAQYVFLHQAALEVLNPIATVCKSKKYRDMWRNLQNETPGCNETKLQTEYKEITKDDKYAVENDSEDVAGFATSAIRDKFSDSKLPENRPKTRNENILPPDEYRPMLLTDGTDDYINAAVLSTYKKPDSLIITQVPLKDTIVDFVRMVRDYEVSTIVLMDDDIPQDCMYWPSSQDVTLSVGQFSVELIREDVLNSHTLRTIRYSFQGSNGRLQSRDVKQFHFTSWNGDIPKVKGHMMRLLADVEKSVTDTSDRRPIVAQCMDGASRSGLFCVMWSVLERLKCEREVALAESIRFIKARRRQIIPNFEQYRFCYEFVLEYLDSCSVYANVM